VSESVINTDAAIIKQRFGVIGNLFRCDSRDFDIGSFAVEVL
jgi:hypothetical protein